MQPDLFYIIKIALKMKEENSNLVIQMRGNENVTLEEIHKDVEEIKKQLTFISSILIEKMSEEDIADYEQAMKEYKKGNATKLSDLRW